MNIYVIIMAKKLLQALKTRWAYNYPVLKRLLELKDAIQELFDKEIVDDIENITDTQGRNAKFLLEILEPFWNTITELEGENYVTLSKVIPSLLEIRFCLQELSRGPRFACSVCKRLIQLLREKFQHVFDPKSGDFEPIYALATFLDPKLSRALDLLELCSLKQAAIAETLRYLKRYASANEKGDEAASDRRVAAVSSHSTKFKNLFAKLDEVSTTSSNRSSNAEVEPGFALI